MENSSNKEIDLYLVIKNILKFIVKNKWIVATFLVAGVVLGWFQIKNNPNKYTNYYQTQFYVKSTLIKDEVLHTLILNLSLNYQNETDTSTLANNILKIKPAKELSVDGLRSDIRVAVDLKNTQDSKELFAYFKKNIEKSEYYQLRYDTAYQQYKQLSMLLDVQLDSLNIDVNNPDLAAIITERTKDKPEQFITYLTIIEKKQTIENELRFLNQAIEFVAFEPVNKPISTRNKKVLTILGYSLMLFIVGIVISAIISFFKKIKS